MRKQVIVPIVEGHGEEKAVPLLVRRWLKRRRFHRYFDVLPTAINAKGCGRLKATYDRRRHIGIEHYVAAALRNNPDAILIVLDADDECLKPPKGKGLGPDLLERAQQVAAHVPLAVVVANREYEAWFLASLTSLRAAGLLLRGKRLPGQLKPEVPRNCKGRIADLMGCPYEERVHQPKLTSRIAFSRGTQFRSPSLGKLVRELERLTREARRRRAS